MRVSTVLAMAGMAVAITIPRGIQDKTDSDEAVVYPASVDHSYSRVDARSETDSDDAVVYPASVDQSWVDARSEVDSDEAVVYPASVDQSWVDADGA
ncbi:hypothetical protein F4780DRAFT_786691 [Xylariomycetidae sp. FL0641]|nr:hypothetical protein F4780DRAFT_786691 [Xylariomycetidae sp. FL0641]